MGYFHTKAILIEKRLVILFNPYFWGQGVHTIPKGISLNVSAIVQLEFELVRSLAI